MSHNLSPVTDIYSRCSKTWDIKRKSKEPGILKDHVEWLKTQFNYSLKRIICDGGGEFTRKELNGL